MDVAELFRQMAARVAGVDASEFGGAVLIVPPQDPLAGVSQPSIEVLMIDPRRDPAAFWAMARGKVEIAAAAFEEAARNGPRTMLR